MRKSEGKCDGMVMENSKDTPRIKLQHKDMIQHKDILQLDHYYVNSACKYAITRLDTYILLLGAK